LKIYQSLQISLNKNFILPLQIILKIRLLYKLLFILLLSASFVNTNAQQQMELSHIHYYPAIFNPAYVASNNDVNVKMLYRSQWLTLNGAPQSQVLLADLPIPYIKSGFGINISNDVIGAQRLTSIAVAYKYKLQIGEYSKIGLGFQAGAFQYQLNGNNLITPTGNYESTVFHNDNILPNITVNAYQPKITAGVNYTNSFLNTGLAVNYIFNAKIAGTNNENFKKYNIIPHYSYNLSINFPVTDNIEIKPALFVHSDLNVHQLSSMLNVGLGNFDVGIGYRGYTKNSNDAVILLAGLQVVKNLLIRYSYDFGLSNLNSSNFGSHEVSMHYKIKNLVKGPLKKIIYNPRYL